MLIRKACEGWRNKTMQNNYELTEFTSIKKKHIRVHMVSVKSTAEKALDEKLGFKFAKLDEHIEKEYERTIEDIFDSEGEEYFRRLEHNALKAFLEKDNIVLSAGGGTPCF